MKNLIVIVVFFVGCLSANAQTNKTFFLGHSLINFHVPNMVNKLSIASGNTFSYEANIGNGANLLYHWNNPTAAQGSPWNTTLPLGGFENFIITEAIPLLGQLQWSSTYRIADSLYQFAKLQNPNIQYYLYETWHCNTTGTPTGCEWDNDDALLWRPRLTADLPKWEGIADSINLIHSKDMLVIPAGQAMARLYDSIATGNVPGITAIEDLFADDIHLTFTGNYFIACLMYGVLHKESPVGLPNQLTDEWGILYTDYPTAAQALIFQRIAWQTLCTYSRDGVDCGPLSVDDMNLTKVDLYSIFPNPTKDKITIKGEEKIESVEVFSITGEKVFENNEVQKFTTEINMSNFNKGIYFVKINTAESSVIKRIVLD